MNTKDISKIRLPKRDIENIKILFKKYFLPNDNLWIFGSRADPKKKGGDIDLYVETNLDSYSIAVDKKISFLSELKQKIGDQKIDVVINLLSSDYKLAIYDIAKEEGCLLT